MAKQSSKELAARRAVAEKAAYETSEVLETLMDDAFLDDPEPRSHLLRTLLRRLDKLNSIQMSVLCGREDGSCNSSAKELREMFESAEIRRYLYETYGT